MSGEKCGQYRVNRNAEREARRLREAQEAAAAARKRLEAALARGPTLAAGEQPPNAAPDVTAEMLDAYVAAANAFSVTLEHRIANSEALKQLRSESGGGDAGTWSGPAADASHSSQETAASRSPTGTPAEREARHALVSRLLGRLREATAEESERVMTLAKALLDCDDTVVADRVEKELRHALQEANAAGDARRADAARAEALLSRIRGLEGEAIADLRGRLEESAAGGRALPAKIEAAVEGARDEEIARSDRDYVARVFREELENCDYLVADDSVETAFARGGQIVAADERNPGYAVEINADPETRKFEMRVVRLDDPGPWSPLRDQRDRGVEDRFCESQQRVRDRMREAGIESWLTEHKRAGEVAVATLVPAAGRKADVAPRKKQPRAAPLPRS